MLRGIRKASSNWLGKAVMAAVMGLLIVSFAIWGIGDIFRGFGLSTVAKIGRTEITTEQFRLLYTDRLQQISRRAGRPITNDQARALGIDRQLISQLLAEASLDEQARQLRLGLADAEVARRITEDPAFKGPSGQFDRVRFDQLIRNAGYTEARFVNEQRRVTVRRQIAETITTGLSAPKTAIDSINRYQSEQRAIEFVALDAKQAGEIAPPTPEVLAKFFDERKGMFRAPEYRKLVILQLTPADLAKSIEVSDDEAKKMYDTNRARFVTPERRHLQQIVFPKPEDAQTAADRLAKGDWFETIATERRLNEKDYDFGLVSKADIIDKAVADAAFALAANAVSAPIKGQFGTALVRVVKIEPEKVRSFDEAKADIKQELATERAKSRLAELRDKIEDARAGGETLSEAAQKVGLKARTIDAISNTGFDPQDNQITDIPSNVLGPAFTTAMGVETDVLQVAGGGYVWYDVAGIEPAHERKLDEVKDKVEKTWRDEQIADRLKTKANAMVEKLKSGSTLAELAAAEGVKVETATGLKRGTPPANLSPAALEAAFQVVKGNPGSAEGGDPSRRIVFRVMDVTVPSLDPNAAEAKQIEEILRNSLTEDLLGQYIARLESELGVSVNQDALLRVVGAQQN